MVNNFKNKLKILKTKAITAAKKSFIPKNRLILLVLAGLSISSFILFVYILLWQFQNIEIVWKFLIEKQPIVIFSTITLFWLIVILSALINSWIWGTGIIFALTTVIMFINSEKMRSRNTPFLPEDLAMASEAGALGGMVNWLNLVFALMVVAAIIWLTFFINKKLSAKLKTNFKKRYTRILRVFLILISISILSSHTDFIRNKTNDNYTPVDFLKTEINSYNQEENYRLNGFVIGTIFNLQPKKMSQPANYSKAEINRIVKKYQKIAKQKNQNLKNLKDEPTNIVFIMNESFIDPTLAKHLYDYGNQDPIPYTRKLLEQNPSGWAISSEYGGGTANVEFEALTGFSNYFLNVMPYSAMISRQPKTPSFAKFLKAHGYATTALHPYPKAMYKRNTVYPNLGFDNFLAQEEFKFTDKIDNAQYISDESSYNAILDELKNKPANQPKFIHLVTMQNHMPYDKGIYNQNLFTVKNNGGKDEEAEMFETYLTGINKSDQAMEKFLSEINNLNQKTLVVFWGDHWPGIFSELFGKQKREYDIRRTPLLIYKNYQTNPENNHPKLGDLSLNYLQLATLENLGVKLSPFHYMLSELRQKFPALTKDLSRDASGEILDDYQMIEFDILSGEKWSLGEFFSAAE